MSAVPLRQGDQEARTAFTVLELNLAAVRMQHVTHDHQPQAGAALARGTGEGLEHLVPSAVGETGDGDDTPESPADLLEQNHPNPFNGSTMIAYTVEESCDVRLCIFDAAGRVVRTLEHGRRGPGRHEVIWDGRDDAGIPVTSGVFLCQLTAGKTSDSRKIVYMR